MAQFTNTQRYDTINNIVDGFKQKIDSPYNILLDLKPYTVRYWNQSIDNSSTDEASNGIYGYVGNNSPLKFNLIEGAVMYGLPQFEIDLDKGDFGLETDFTAESVVLPNTWIPYPGDFFIINHSNIQRLFMVTKATPNTLPNGANFYKVQFTLSTKDLPEIEGNTISKYRFIMDNVGTSYSSVVRSSLYDDIAELEKTTDKLKRYFNNIFFQGKVQTFVYNFNGSIFYDPYMIEFMQRNNIFKGYTFLTHAVPVSKTFAIEYDRTIMHAVEEHDINIKLNTNAVAKLIENKLTLFYSRPDNYYQIDYNTNVLADEVPIMDIDLFTRIKNNNLYENIDDINRYKNIIIKHFNSTSITVDDIKYLNDIDYLDNIELFYNIPIIIYIIEYFIRQSLKYNKNALLTPNKTVCE